MLHSFSVSAAALLLSVPAALPVASAEPRLDEEVRRLVALTVERGEIPGAVLRAGRGEETLEQFAVGSRALEPEQEPMTLDTVFDLASLTKVVATATSVMQLVDRGRVELAAPVARYLEEFGAAGKGTITVEDLLLHRGGLVPDNPLADYADGPKEAWRRICALEPLTPPGTAFAYTDVGYIVLGRLVQAVDGRPLDVYAREEIFEPLGMGDTGFRPPAPARARCAPTERREGRWMRGEVHDPRAWALGGVAGHAGLFATAADLARWCRMILGRGELDGVRVLSAAAVAEMTRARWLPDKSGGRGLGFDVDTPYSSPRGDRFPRGASFGHTGFTGTSLWLDPETQGYVVLLANRVHPDGAGKVVALRRAVSARVARMLRPAPAWDGVETGLDVLAAEGCARLAGQRVGLLTHQVGRTRGGVRTIDVLARAPNVELARIFVPEHGLLAALEGKVGDGRDEATGVEIASLYGEERRPRPEHLADLATLVVDLQDVGVRFYTYSTTLGMVMEACAAAGVRVVVLDRPNPIAFLGPDGPRADVERRSFINYLPLPLTHALTLGELARLYRDHFGIPCEVEVVPCRGWRRDMRWHETGLPWIAPSPNLRNPTQAVLYPAIGLLEGSNLSVGRGTDEPFERLGAPWIDGVALAAALRADPIAGLRFTPTEFTPRENRFAGERCGGVQIEVVDDAAYRPAAAGLALAWHLNRLFGGEFDAAAVDDRLFSQGTWEAWMRASTTRGFESLWASDVAEFAGPRAKAALYD